MLAGMVLFCVISAVVHISPRLGTGFDLNKILQVTVLALSFVLIKTGLSVFDRKLQAIPGAASPVHKLRQYKTAAIIKWAMIEGAVLLSAVSFMITRNYAFIALAFALLLFFAFQGPVKLKLMLQLQLTEQDFAVLEHPSL